MSTWSRLRTRGASARSDAGAYRSALYGFACVGLRATRSGAAARVFPTGTANVPPADVLSCEIPAMATGASSEGFAASAEGGGGASGLGAGAFVRAIDARALFTTRTGTGAGGGTGGGGGAGFAVSTTATCTRTWVAGAGRARARATASAATACTTTEIARAARFMTSTRLLDLNCKLRHACAFQQIEQMRHRAVGGRAVGAHHRLHVLALPLGDAHRLDQVLVVRFGAVEKGPAFFRYNDRQRPLRDLCAIRRAGQIDLDRRFRDHARGHHEHDEQHQRHVDEGGDVDSVDPFLLVHLRKTHGSAASCSACRPAAIACARALDRPTTRFKSRWKMLKA